MVRKAVVCAALLGATAILGGCDFFSSTGVNITQLEVLLSLAANEVPSGGSVAVDIQIYNSGIDRATVRPEGDCLAELWVERGGAKQAFRIQPSPCWAPSGSVVVEPGETVRHSWVIHAESEDGTPAAPGTYSVVADVSGRMDDIYLPGAIRTLTVVE